ncbi:MAG TPA: hypothetical protein VKY89_01975 [Thermoanaerobaculia bacterium]|nr:hypothetical protein [Thermoanaerobaculia bacterium]
MTRPAAHGASASASDRRRGRVRRAWLLPIWLAVWPAVTLPALAAAEPLRGGAGPAWTALPLQPGEAPAINAERGFAVALDGNQAAVGARFDGPTGAGRVYVFFWDGRTWLEETVLEGGLPGDQFGIAVALRGDTLAVGAVGEERDQQTPAGQVHVFVGGLQVPWTEVSTVAGEPGVRQTGRAVALDDTWLAVAATEDLPGGEQGVVRVYPLVPNAGIAPGSTGEPLLRVDPQAGDRFGESLAMAAGVLVAGAPAHAGGAGLPAAGEVYVYLPTLPPAVSLMPVATLQAADTVTDGNFGSAVAVSSDGHTLAVGAPGAAGAPGAPPAIGRPGAVYVFAASTGTGPWTQQARLAPSPASADAGDRFGQSVGIDGDLLVAGAPQHAAGAGAPAAGAAFLFQRDAAGTWAEMPGAAAAGAATAHALYGFAAALSQGAFLVGAPLAADSAGATVGFFPAFQRPDATAAAARAAATAHSHPAARPAAAPSLVTATFAVLPVTR